MGIDVSVYYFLKRLVDILPEIIPMTAATVPVPRSSINMIIGSIGNKGISPKKSTRVGVA